MTQLAGTSKFNEQKGSVITVFAIFLGVIALLTVLVFYVFGQIVRPNQIGIRQNYYSVPGILQKGFESSGLLPGLHWKAPWVSTIHTIRRDFLFIHLNDANRDGELSLDQLKIQTTDGSKVETDMTLIVRFLEAPGKGNKVDLAAATEGPQTGKRLVPVAVSMLGEHGGPADLISRFGISQGRQLSLFIKQAEDYIRNALTNLSTTDYYDPVLRETAALSAKKSINEAVNPLGVELWAGLIRRYVYSEKKIDDQIFQKNLQEQTEKLNAAKRGLEEARALTKDKLAGWDAKIKDVQVTAEQEKVVITSEADRYEIEQRSRGDLLVQEAIARVDSAKNQVLAQTAGAGVYVAREMTPLLQTLEGGVVTDIDPYDVDAWVNKLVKEVR